LYARRSGRSHRSVGVRTAPTPERWESRPVLRSYPPFLSVARQSGSYFLTARVWIFEIDAAGPLSAAPARGLPPPRLNISSSIRVLPQVLHYARQPAARRARSAGGPNAAIAFTARRGKAINAGGEPRPPGTLICDDCLVLARPRPGSRGDGQLPVAAACGEIRGCALHGCLDFFRRSASSAQV